MSTAPLAVLLLVPRHGAGDSPSMFAPRGPAAARVATLGWVAIAVATAVFVVFMAMLLVPLWRNRDRTAPERAQHEHPAEQRWIVGLGFVVPLLILVGMYALSTVDTAALAAPPGPVAATVEIVGRQWWWEVRYPGEGIVTANELHIPVGRPVRVRLASIDVIHSFWVPRLAPKMDLIPGRVNTTWIQADTAGTYLGECAEFCGAQHAHMGFTVVADPPGVYAAWLAAQRAPAASPADPAAAAGRQTFVAVGLRRVPRGARHGGGRAGRARSHARRQPPHARRRHAAQHARQPGRVDRERAGHQAGQPHAGGRAVRTRPAGAPRVPGIAPVTALPPRPRP